MTATKRKTLPEPPGITGGVPRFTQPGRIVRLQDPEVKDAMAALKRRMARDPEFARQVMMETGVWDEKGQLTPLYGGK